MDSGHHSMLKLWKQALITFSGNSGSNSRGQHFLDNFCKLRTLADRITAEHVNLDTSLVNSSELTRYSRRTAPMTYIEVYEDSNVTIGIFILKSGARLPLHDHPHMHGILKVLHGTVQVQSYTVKKDVRDAINTSPQPSQDANTLVAEKHSEVLVESSSAACVLTPVERNLHEIRTVGGSAAFLDILSPPYDSDAPDSGERSCHYYREVPCSGDESKSKDVKLRRVPSPSDFWNDSAPYSGPTLR